MIPSSSIGRIGGLAVALGIGAAVLAVPGVAWAEPASDASDSVSNAADSPESTGGPRTQSRRAATPLPSASRKAAPAKTRGSTRPANPGPLSSASSAGDPVTGSIAPPAPRAVDAVAVLAPADSALDSMLDSMPDSAVDSVLLAAPIPSAVASITANPVDPPHTAPTAVNRVVSTIGSVVGRIGNLFSGNSPWAPYSEMPVAWAVLGAVRRQLPGAAATASEVAALDASPVLVLNGYHVVPTSTVNVVSLYGMFTHWPSFAGVVQGTQSFSLVDPVTGEVVGSFNALVGKNNSFAGSLRDQLNPAGTQRTVFTEIVVTEVLSGTPGAEAGQIPPVGSVISSIGDPRLQTVYWAMPTETGYSVAFKFITPFGTFSIPMPYNAAKGLTDDEYINAPMALAQGFYIAPETPSTQTLISASGFSPLFTAIQGRQTFSVYDLNGNPVGNFEGLVTTTSDLTGIHTKAILVTANDGGPDVGVDVGQVPPVGTVYNVIYLWSDKTYILYTSKPSTPRDLISTKVVTPFGPSWTISLLNASSPPPIESYKVPAGYTFVPVSDLQPIGVNGLPPREVIVQGYQRFDVYDQTGTKVGSFDADVSRQWDNEGGHSEAILVTNVTDGTPGVTAGAIPPVGSVFNFAHFGLPGFSVFNSAMPGPQGDLVANVIVTPINHFLPNSGFIPLWLPYDAAKDLADYTYIDPWVP